MKTCDPRRGGDPPRATACPAGAASGQVERGGRLGRRTFVAGALALASARLPAAIPAWQDLPQGKAIAGPDGHSWALALADPYVVDTLGVGYRFAENVRGDEIRAYWLEMLRTVWGVTDRRGLLQQMAALRAHGHRALFEALRAQARERGAWRRAVDRLLDPDEARRRAVVERDSAQLGPAGILAFDASRYVNLARVGVQVGFLSESEAWRLVMPMARLAQASFDSWAAYGRSFLVGRDFSGGATADDPQARFVRIVGDLQARPDGGWRRHPWRLPLDGTPIRAADPEANGP
jgi:hypothetical protein